jgi:hypothetical protein
MSIQCASDLKAVYEEALRFKQVVARLEGQDKNPWDYENYGKLVKKCLNFIEPIATRSFPLRILREAHYMESNPRFFWNDKIVEYSQATQQVGITITKIFQKLCQEPNNELLKEFSESWTVFVLLIFSDTKVASDYFSKQN